jgi:hypothetical protein
MSGGGGFIGDIVGGVGDIIGGVGDVVWRCCKTVE